jgi:hypothetical protein
MKKEFEKRFYELFDGYRLLAIQLNGFSHSAIVDKGDSISRIERWEFTNYMGTAEKIAYGENMDMDKKLSILFSGFGHLSYQHNAKELVYINPNER